MASEAELGLALGAGRSVDSASTPCSLPCLAGAAAVHATEQPCLPARAFPEGDGFPGGSSLPTRAGVWLGPWEVDPQLPTGLF